MFLSRIGVVLSWIHLMIQMIICIGSYIYWIFQKVYVSCVFVDKWLQYCMMLSKKKAWKFHQMDLYHFYSFVCQKKKPWDFRLSKRIQINSDFIIILSDIFIIRSRPGIELRSLERECDLNKVRSLWVYGNSKVVPPFDRMAKYNSSVGAFDANGTLVSWILR